MLMSVTKVTIATTSISNANPTIPAHISCVVPRVANTGMPKMMLDARKMTRQMTPASFALMRKGRMASMNSPVVQPVRVRAVADHTRLIR